ncbi:uncharacterized protein BDW43DRAFT_302014 [Aspergillus alliaceus]|uniref:uncharacterized protein n=1 Tax=Petromyces alliaceus TaxID=209559 RepID=UPI0012A49A7E|nr:uncharacterized protein BDW43DRAFT_302014 [Aspergillus alliaceus]KAB8230896.1 hypothetical protein BDW43DRAFT_302014 [Aspergillus alliaceus]
MECFAGFVPFWIRQWIAPSSRNIQKQESIFFLDAERAMGVDDLVVTFRRNFVLDRYPWSEYKSIGSEATSAVVEAGWSCSELDRIAAFLHVGIFDKRKLDRLRQQARNNRRRISSGKPAGYPSVLE